MIFWRFFFWRLNCIVLDGEHPRTMATSHALCTPSSPMPSWHRTRSCRMASNIAAAMVPAPAHVDHCLPPTTTTTVRRLQKKTKLPHPRKRETSRFGPRRALQSNGHTVLLFAVRVYSARTSYDTYMLASLRMGDESVTTVSPAATIIPYCMIL